MHGTYSRWVLPTLIIMSLVLRTGHRDSGAEWTPDPAPCRLTAGHTAPCAPLVCLDNSSGRAWLSLQLAHTSITQCNPD